MSANESSAFKAVPSKWVPAPPNESSNNDVKLKTSDWKRKALNTVYLDPHTKKLIQTPPSTPGFASDSATTEEEGISPNLRQLNTPDAETGLFGDPELIVDSDFAPPDVTLGLPSRFGPTGRWLPPINADSALMATLMSPGQAQRNSQGAPLYSHSKHSQARTHKSGHAAGVNQQWDSASSNKGKAKSSEHPHPPVPEITLQEEFSDSSANLGSPSSPPAEHQGGVKVGTSKKTKWQPVAQYRTDNTGHGWTSDVPSEPPAQWPSSGFGHRSSEPPRAPASPPPRPFDNPDGESPWITLSQGIKKQPEPDYGLSLKDWDGNWAPAPVCWEDRPALSNYLNWRLFEWKNRCTFEKIQLDEALNDIPAECEIAPAFWIPYEIDDEMPTVWWAKFSKDPDADPSLPPFWNRYSSMTSTFLQPWPIPEARIERRDHNPDELRKAQRQTSSVSSAHYNNRAQRKATNARQRAQLTWNQDPSSSPHSEIPRNQWSPQANIYLRPAIQGDLAQCLDIYNHYIEKTVFTPEMEPITGPQMIGRWEDSQEEKLPFIVAVDAAHKNRRARNQVQTIVGFAYANDHNEMRGMYRYTAELEMFVKPNWLRQGIGRTLLDKMISLLDSGYVPRGGYEFDGNDLNYGPGGRRVIGNILAPVPYNSADRGKVNWMESWLQQWGFHKAADFPDIGIKHNQRVSQAIFYLKTQTHVNTWAP